MNTLASSSTALVYQNLLKPILFQFDAESVHDFMVANGKRMGNISLAKNVLHSAYSYQHKALEQTIAGIKFTNPIGLSAGFDYDAHLTQILPSIGFGFHSIGTVTSGYYEGNQKPRLGRLPKSKSLLVNKGFKSGGVDEVISRIKKLQFDIPVGVSVGSTNKIYDHPSQQIQSYIDTFEKVEKKLSRISYYELNISCPNLKTGEPFTTPKRLQTLLTEVEKLHLKRPMFIKMPTDISLEESRNLIKTAHKYTVSGFIYGNLTKDRKNPDLDPSEVASATAGNFSGKPVEKRANALLADSYKQFGDEFIYIGCGGVFTAEDAYLKIKLGASLVQMITGMIYQGPQVIGQINKGLVELLKKDGFDHISQARGTANRI